MMYQYKSGFVKLVVIGLMTLFHTRVNGEASSFTPGCSFSGGQCVYSVTLGHQGQCDSATPGPTAQCCDDVNKRVVDLERLTNDLKSQVMALTDQSRPTQADLQLALARAVAAESQRDQLVKTLAQKDAEILSLTNGLQNCSNTGTVPGESETGVNGTSSPGTSIGDGDPASYIFYCDFTNPTECGIDTATSGIKFKLMKHGQTEKSGPKAEHTTGTRGEGTYLGLDTYEIGTNHRFGTGSGIRTAVANTPLLEPAPAYCIMFWYSMLGPDVVGLDINVKLGTGSGYPVWSKSGSQHGEWNLGTLTLDSEYTSNPFKIVFAGKTDAHQQESHTTWEPHYDSYNYFGDIAIDDVYIYNTSCSNIDLCPKNSYKRTVNNVTSCYTFHTIPMTWHEAYNVCRREGPRSALVSLETRAENDYLVNIIKNDNALRVLNGFFTSGNDLVNEKTFVWTGTGTARGLGYTYWHSGQPNDVGSVQDCLVMGYPTDGYEWGDFDCSSKYSFICEASYTV